MIAIAAVPAAAQNLDAARLLEPDDGEWIMDGRRYDAQRYSPLTMINENNVGELGLAWYHELETLGSDLSLPPLPDAPPLSDPPPLRASEASIAQGAQLFADACSECHGQMAIGGVTHLRLMTPEAHNDFNRIMLEGTRVEQGMGSFADLLSADELEAIHAYLISRANEDWGQIISAQQ